jgi:5'-deoxynucleotidase YfbR-like HD superfamily hydrolase
MAFKFLACTLRSSHSAFADSMIDLWYEYEEGKTDVAVLVRQIDKLECMHQAVIYEERDGIDMSEFMELRKAVTLKELKPLLDACLQKHEEVVARKEAGLFVIFVSGMLS